MLNQTYWVWYQIVPSNMFGVIGLNSKFEPCSSSNGWDNFLVPCFATRKVVAPLANDTIMSTRSIRLYTHLDVKIHPIFQILMTEQDVQRSLVPIFATREELKLLANDPIMSGRSIPLFRHFQCQNLSTGYAFIHSREIFFYFYFWPLKRHCRYSEMILFCQEDQYSSLYTLNLKIHPLFQIL